MRDGLRQPRRIAIAAMVALAACGKETLPTETIAPDPVANLGSRSTTLTSGTTAAEYMVVIANTALNGTSSASYSLQGLGLAPSASLVADRAATRTVVPIAAGADDPGIARTIEARIRDTERRELSGRIAGAQAWYASRPAPASAVAGPAGRSAAAIPAGAKVGDVVRVNVQGDSACTSPVYHGARIAAIGQRAMILEDTLNPKNGFTDTDYRRYAARFDTLVYPLDSAAFGAPTDIDNNGHVAIIFTRAVNELTPSNSSSYFSGFTFSRDLFPIAGTARTLGCPGSNEGEYFYLLAPDPLGEVNGNLRTTAFVDSVTTAVIAHEFQHLINSGRRLYVNNAPGFEEKWLDEGLAHVAEELLFYRESGLVARANLDASALRATNRTLFAFNRDMSGNDGRYRSYLMAPRRSSPFAHDDDLTTRGAAWSLLRYLADRSAAADGDLYYRLVNSRVTGIDNLTAVFGPGIATSVRDWNVSHAADDLATQPEFQQPSWNWHSIYSRIGSGVYPLQYQAMSSGTTYTGSVLSGGAAYFKITVPANSSATVSLIEQSTAASTLSLVTVRTR